MPFPVVLVSSEQLWYYFLTPYHHIDLASRKRDYLDDIGEKRD